MWAVLESASSPISAGPVLGMILALLRAIYDFHKHQRDRKS